MCPHWVGEDGCVHSAHTALPEGASEPGGQGPDSCPYQGTGKTGKFIN